MSNNYTLDKGRLNEIMSYIKEFTDSNDILLCGGTVRYIFGIENSFRDIDLIVKNNFDLSNIPSDFILNMYNGYKFKIRDHEIDLWKLKDHIIPCETFEDVENTWLLSTDAIYYNPANNKLYNTFFKRHLEINFDRDIKDCEKTYLNLKLKKFLI